LRIAVRASISVTERYVDPDRAAHFAAIGTPSFIATAPKVRKLIRKRISK
jgi:hypothetical protein